MVRNSGKGLDPVANTRHKILPMIRSAVTLSLVSEARGGPFVYWDDPEKAFSEAKELGFDAVEVFGPSGAVLREIDMPALSERHEISIAAVGTGAGAVIHGWTLSSADETVRGKAIGFVKEIIDAGAAVKAPAIIGSMQGRHDKGESRDDARLRLGSALQELAAHAASQGVDLFIEPLNRYESNLLNQVEESATWASSLGCPNLKILADLFHMNIEEVDVASALKAAGAGVGHVHFVDSNRRATGMGHTDFAPIVDALKGMGYDGYLSAEAFPLPDSMQAAKATIESFRRYFG